VREHLKKFNALLDEAAEFVRSRMEAGAGRDDIVQQYVNWNRKRAEAEGISSEVFQEYEVTNPLFMSVDGMVRYWRKMSP
jgi:hypothetical protein